MYIHTIVYNQNPIINININIESNFNKKIIFWNYSKILTLIKTKYFHFYIFFKKLILNKSRENFAKYIIINEFGGYFININIIKILNKKNIKKIENILLSKNEMVFWLETEQNIITLDILDISENILNDDIFFIKNTSNSFINWLIKEINTTIIPINEFENKINLGNIFLSNKLFEFYLKNLNIRSGINNYYFNNLHKMIKSKKKKLEFEKSIYLIKIKNNIPSNQDYKLITYPNVLELTNSEKILNPWNIPYKIINYIENIIILIIFQYKNWYVIIILIILITSINILLKKNICDNLNVIIKPYSIDSITFFHPKKFKIFKELGKYWKEIRDEALWVLSNTDKLNLSRTIYDWHDSKSYFKTIQNKLGWIRSWEYDPNGNEHNQNSEGNYEWLNYGLLYYEEEFSENIKYCSKTINILRKIKKHINICGFSLMLGGCFLQPHTDDTGLSNNCLAFHLGLSIPEPLNSCRMIIKNNLNELVYVNEVNGKMIIFDATFEHYAYNQSNQDRLILYIDFKTDSIL